jgi:hypothetical protein
MLHQCVTAQQKTHLVFKSLAVPIRIVCQPAMCGSSHVQEVAWPAGEGSTKGLLCVGQLGGAEDSSNTAVDMLCCARLAICMQWCARWHK